MPGGQSEGGREGANAVVESDGHRLGGGENKGRRGGRQTVPADRDRARTEKKNERRKGKTRARQAGPAGRSGVERVQMSGSESQEE